MTSSICDDYYKSVNVRKIKGPLHCRSITLSNGVIVRTEEQQAGQIKHVDAITCPDSYKLYGDIGTNGVIVYETKQVHEFITPSQAKINDPSTHKNKKKIFFLNGFLITNDSLKISPKAIKRIQALKPEKFKETENNDSVILINIWTLTKKEINKSLKSCRRSYE
jgi:hypothetical protein